MRRLIEVFALVVFLVASGASAAPHKFLKKTSKALDESDPVQVTIYQVLVSYPDFEDVLGPAYTEAEQRAYMDELLSEADDKVQALQFLEAEVPTLRHVTLTLDGAEGTYSEQSAVFPANTSHTKIVSWAMNVPDEAAARDKATEISASIEKLLGKDRKWQSQAIDREGFIQKTYKVRQKYSLSGEVTIENVHVSVVYVYSDRLKRGTVSTQVMASTVKIGN